jgi:hypothetical protein
MFKSVVAALLLALALPSLGSPQAEALGRCLTDSTTGKDRKDLARWIFLAMAAHPEIRQLSNADAAATQASSRTAGQLFTRLLADDCPAQTRAAVQAGGAMAIQLAFQTLGQVAMQELMANPDVATSMADFQRHIDQPRLAPLLEAR